jgi:hypothetical protein
MWRLLAVIGLNSLTIEATPMTHRRPFIISLPWPVGRSYGGDPLYNHFGSDAGRAIDVAVEKHGPPDEWPTIVLKPCWGCKVNGARGGLGFDECAVCRARSVTRCVDCGGFDRALYFRETRERLLTDQRCFDCDHFQRLVGAEWAVITPEFRHYAIGSGGGHSASRGFGGAKWAVTFDDGTVVETDDLWMQGDIPEHLQHLFSPNAVVKSGWSAGREIA